MTIGGGEIGLNGIKEKGVWRTSSPRVLKINRGRERELQKVFHPQKTNKRGANEADSRYSEGSRSKLTNARGGDIEISMGGSKKSLRGVRFF